MALTCAPAHTVLYLHEALRPAREGRAGASAEILHIDAKVTVNPSQILLVCFTQLPQSQDSAGEVS